MSTIFDLWIQFDEEMRAEILPDLQQTLDRVYDIQVKVWQRFGLAVPLPLHRDWTDFDEIPSQTPEGKKLNRLYQMRGYTMLYGITTSGPATPLPAYLFSPPNWLPGTKTLNYTNLEDELAILARLVKRSQA